MPDKKHPTIGCCGIDCGLCPRYYTVGTSRCPGCGGEGFAQKHPACGFLSCCAKKLGLEVCAECGDFPCRRFDRETGERDSFVTHARVLPNQRLIAEIGMGAFLQQQNRRINFLQTALKHHDDGRSKSLFCIAAALLTVESLDEAMSCAGGTESLKEALLRFSQIEGQALKLRK